VGAKSRLGSGRGLDLQTPHSPRNNAFGSYGRSQRSKNPMIPATKRTVNSCLRCRARKIRCGREKPECQNCARHGHSCRYAPTTPSEPIQTNATRPEGYDAPYKELAQRLSHLETVVARLAGNAAGSSPEEGSAVSSIGDVQIVDSEPRLLSGSYWKQLAAQVRSSCLKRKYIL
jgi:ribosomal protein L37AE/L43A